MPTDIASECNQARHTISYIVFILVALSIGIDSQCEETQKVILSFSMRYLVRVVQALEYLLALAKVVRIQGLEEEPNHLPRGPENRGVEAWKQRLAEAHRVVPVEVRVGCSQHPPSLSVTRPRGPAP